MSQKYENTIFNQNVKFNIPVKKSESRNYFFKVPMEGVGYIGLDLFFVLIVYYFILTLFWFNLYQQHFLITTLITGLNVLLSTIVLFRHSQSGKNMFDMLKILWRYMGKKQIRLIKPFKNDLISQFQKEEL